MSADKLKLEVLMGLVEKVTGPLKNITKGSSTTAKALKAAKDELKQLNDAQNRADGWRKTSKDVAIVGNQLKAARQHLKNVKAAMAETTIPTREMQRALKDAQQQVSTYGMRLSGLIGKKQRLHTELVANGVDLKNLKRYQSDLAGQIDKATAAVDRETAAMKRQNAVAAHMHAAQANYQKSMAWHGKLTGSGRMTVGAGITAGAPIALAVKQFVGFEDAMLGVARQVQGARDANGKLTATYYEIGDAIKSMSERVPLATTELAEILAMGARMGIQGKDDLLAFTETSATMAAAFDISAGEIGDSMGALSQLYKVPIKDIGQLGDAINWLDDNARSNGGDIIEVMQRIAGSAAMANMDFKKAAALGSTFLTLGAGREVAASASNAMIRELSIATMQTKRFQAGLDMLKLDAKDIQLGMNKDSTGTILKVLEAIRALPQEQQLEAATRLFGKEFGDDASKLAVNIDEYRRQLELVNDAQAKGSMDQEAKARLEALSAQYTLAKNTMSNVAVEIGANLKPALVDLLQAGAGVLKNVRDWMKENPGLTAALVKIAAVGAVVVTVIGAIMFIVGALLAPIAMLKFGLAYLGVGAGGAVSSLIAFLSPLVKLTAAFSAGYAIGTLINGWLDSFISKIFGYKTTLGGAIFDIVEMFRKTSWADIGMMILRGLETGLDFLTAGLYSKVKKITAGIVSTAKSVFGIKSPSTVFNVIGRYTMAGLSGGIDAGRQGAVSAVSNAARKVAAAGVGMMIGGAAMAGPAIDTRPALAGQGAGGLAAAPITINVYGAPGQSAQDIATAVRVELEKIERQRSARGRSRLSDRE